VGVCIDICLDKDIPDAEMHDTDGKTLADCAETLDQICKAKALTPTFSSFIVDPEAMAEDVSEGQTMEEKWYDAGEGLKVVAGLIAAMEAPDRKLRKRIDKRGGILTPLWRAMGIKSGMDGKWAEFLLADLKELERCLKLAVQATARFYLLAC
jgi:hypothetical protein